MRNSDINLDSRRKVTKYIGQVAKGSKVHDMYRPLLEFQLFCDSRSLPINQESMEQFIETHQCESWRKYIQPYIESVTGKTIISNSFNEMSKQEQMKYLSENKLNIVNSNNKFVIQIGTVVLNSDKNIFTDEQTAWQQGIKLQTELKKQLLTKP